MNNKIILPMSYLQKVSGLASGRISSKIKAVFPCLLLLFAPLPVYADNPIVSHVYTAHPAARVVDGRVYVVVTHDEDDQTDYSQLRNYYLFSSDDMVNWRDHGIIFDVTTDTS